MDIKMDLHTHTVASGHHTTDTITTLAKRASERGLIYLGVTDHAPKMQGSASENYFRNLKYCDKVIHGVKILYGVELNVLNVKGEVDLSEEVLYNLDYAIAGLHKQVFKPKSQEENTEALLKAMKNPYVACICHPDDPTFKIDVKRLVEGAKDTGCLLEVSSVGLSAESYRGYGIARLVEMLLLCKKEGVSVMLGSDSHGAKNIANFNNSFKLLKELEFPLELVINNYPERFLELVKSKKTKRI